MIVFDDVFSQFAVAATARKFDTVRSWLSNWMMNNQYPVILLTTESEQANTPLHEWKWETIIRPEQPVMTKIKLFVGRGDLHCEKEGIAQEISFCWYHSACDKYGVPTRWNLGSGGIRNGILFNHGTIEEPNWSIHT